MRIIAGEAGGRRLLSPQGDATRPTNEQTRGAIFNVLGRKVPGSRVLDLFGGTGAMALEAMSRGAEACVINDSVKKTAGIISRNAETVLGSEKDRCTVLCSDYRACLRKLAGQRFDLVFLDPPYAMRDAYTASLALMTDLSLLEEGATVVIERAADCPPPAPDGFETVFTRKYGDTVIDMITYHPTEKA